MEPINRRSSDKLIVELTQRVELLDEEVTKLRTEFESHMKSEDVKYSELKNSLFDIQSKVNLILVEIKEPIESYKTAKYGVTFIKIIADTAKWLVPLIVGLVVFYGATTAYEIKTAEKTKIESNKGN